MAVQFWNFSVCIFESELRVKNLDIRSQQLPVPVAVLMMPVLLIWNVYDLGMRLRGQCIGKDQEASQMFVKQIPWNPVLVATALVRQAARLWYQAKLCPQEWSNVIGIPTIWSVSASCSPLKFQAWDRTWATCQSAKLVWCLAAVRRKQ